MDARAKPRRRGLRLLEAHLRSLDPASPSARTRLEAQLGGPLTHKLLFALARGQRGRRAA